MKGFMLSLFITLCAWHMHAQEMIFSTNPAAKKVGIQDRFEVKYTIENGSNLESFALAPMPDFDVLSNPSKSYRTSITNGHAVSTIELTVILKPKRKGTLIIPGGIARGGGQTYRSNDVAIEVVDGSVAPRSNQQRSNNPFDDPFFNQDPFGGGDPFAAMQQQQMQMLRQLQRMQNQAFPQRQGAPQMRAPEQVAKKDIANNIFIKVDVDKSKVALGEQITATYKLYTRLPMEVNLTKLPSLVGFWSHDFKIPQPAQARREVYNGKEFNVFELKKSALFPTQSGTLALDPAEAEGSVKVVTSKKVKEESPFQDMFGGDPFGDQFSTMYDYEDVPVKLKSAPISIVVGDLPSANKPLSFDGAVGTYSLESAMDKTEFSTDDNVVLTLRIKGTGNLKLIGAPKLKLPVEIDSYDPAILDTITNNTGIISGEKTFSYTLSARSAGTFVIPPTEFSYYDPTSHSYKTATTPTYTLHVKQGKNTFQNSKKLPRDIHDIVLKPSSIKNEKTHLIFKSPLFWSGFAIPLFAYLGLMIYKKKEEELEQDVVLFKHKKANKIALKRLALAETHLKKSERNLFYEETSKAVWLYLSDKLNIPLANLSKDVAAEKLLEKNIHEETRSEINRITNECEMALYSPQAGKSQMQQTYMDALKLIGTLEDLLS